MDLIKHINRQKIWSEKAFGHGKRTLGICDHISKELNEIKNDPDDLMEWVDVIMMAIDGAWRAGYSPEEIASSIYKKQVINEEREWPDYRYMNPDKAIEHIREK